eukprot:m.1187224 g.1187224  ORF g.1187224 m.1187224 type:complete len:752 (-) comp24548_c0_seq76:3583-5838(-)
MMWRSTLSAHVLSILFLTQKVSVLTEAAICNSNSSNNVGSRPVLTFLHSPYFLLNGSLPRILIFRAHINASAIVHPVLSVVNTTQSVTNGSSLKFGFSHFINDQNGTENATMAPVGEDFRVTFQLLSTAPLGQLTLVFHVFGPHCTYDDAIEPHARTTIVLSDTRSPTGVPTSTPTRAPPPSPTAVPTTIPTSVSPTNLPTLSPVTSMPTAFPTSPPTTQEPTSTPTTQEPTSTPTTKEPTSTPTPSAPTEVPTHHPTAAPTTVAPTLLPTRSPTDDPSRSPTIRPTLSPTSSPPTPAPSTAPSVAPSSTPTDVPTISPTQAPFVVSTTTASPTVISSVGLVVVTAGSSVDPTGTGNGQTDASAEDESRSTGSFGIMVGAVLGGLVVVIFLIVVVRRRQQRGTKEGSDGAISPGAAHEHSLTAMQHRSQATDLVGASPTTYATVAGSSNPSDPTYASTSPLSAREGHATTSNHYADPRLAITAANSSALSSDEIVYTEMDHKGHLPMEQADGRELQYAQLEFHTAKGTDSGPSTIPPLPPKTTKGHGWGAPVYGNVPAKTEEAPTIYADLQHPSSGDVVYSDVVHAEPDGTRSSAGMGGDGYAVVEGEGANNYAIVGALAGAVQPLYADPDTLTQRGAIPPPEDTLYETPTLGTGDTQTTAPLQSPTKPRSRPPAVPARAWQGQSVHPTEHAVSPSGTAAGTAGPEDDAKGKIVYSSRAEMRERIRHQSMLEQPKEKYAVVNKTKDHASDA